MVNYHFENTNYRVVLKTANENLIFNLILKYDLNII